MDHGAEISSQASKEATQGERGRKKRRRAEDSGRLTESQYNYEPRWRRRRLSLPSLRSRRSPAPPMSRVSRKSHTSDLSLAGPDPERILPSFRAWVEIRGVGNAIRDAAQVPSLVLIGAPLMSVTSCTFLPYLFSNSTRPTQLRRTTVPHSSSLPRSAGECPT